MTTPERIPLTTHILDTTRGLPAAGVPITLFRQDGDQWIEVDKSVTDLDGRGGFLKGTTLHCAVFKLTFQTGDYFAKTNTKSFYPYVEVIFQIDDPEPHYHVPLLLNPFSYTTYRGS